MLSGLRKGFDEWGLGGSPCELGTDFSKLLESRVHSNYFCFLTAKIVYNLVFT